jgi:hypothetical protein
MNTFISKLQRLRKLPYSIIKVLLAKPLRWMLAAKGKRVILVDTYPLLIVDRRNKIADQADIDRSHIRFR